MAHYDTPTHHQLYHAVVKNLRDDLKRAFARRVVYSLPFEEASYWLSKVDTTRGKRAFKMLFGFSEERS